MDIHPKFRQRMAQVLKDQMLVDAIQTLERQIPPINKLAAGISDLREHSTIPTRHALVALDTRTISPLEIDVTFSSKLFWESWDDPMGATSLTYLTANFAFLPATTGIHGAADFFAMGSDYMEYASQHLAYDEVDGKELPADQMFVVMGIMRALSEVCTVYKAPTVSDGCFMVGLFDDATKVRIDLTIDQRQIANYWLAMARYVSTLET